MRSLAIRGTGKYLPKNRVCSSIIDDKLLKDKGWTEKYSGVVCRHFADITETTSFMASEASNMALANANLSPLDIDCIVGACAVMEQPMPSTSVLVQKKLGLSSKNITTFDINSSCLSFLSALDTVSYMIEAGRFKNVLIFSSDIASVGLNWNHMESCTILGDGAAAALISAPLTDNKFEILASCFVTFCEGSEYCRIQAGGTRLHPTHFKEDLYPYTLFEMNGREAFKLTARHINKFTDELFTKTNYTLEDINWCVPHQASQLAMNHIRKILKIPNEKLIDIFSTHGNQVAASIPTALHELVISGKIKNKDKILLLGTSAGISIGGIVIEYNA